ncbi:unnamed protein product [Meganyctiphanes norvegica]|uniref:Secreted protein n=1 Tax=Meganyctiphanes norvegica TaxID=48144 RepID=A0AAV2RRB3_MEGNR
MFWPIMHVSCGSFSISTAVIGLCRMSVAQAPNSSFSLATNGLISGWPIPLPICSDIILHTCHFFYWTRYDGLLMSKCARSTADVTGCQYSTQQFLPFKKLLKWNFTW